MSNTDFAQKHYDSENFRIGAIYWLAVCNDGMRLPDELHDDFDDTCWEQAFGSDMPDYIDSGEELAQELLDRELCGFLACVDIQQPSAVHSSGYSTRGWGIYWTHWVYAESTEELYAKAKAAADKLINQRLAKLREKAA